METPFATEREAIAHYARVRQSFYAPPPRKVASPPPVPMVAEPPARPPEPVLPDNPTDRQRVAHAFLLLEHMRKPGKSIRGLLPVVTAKAFGLTIEEVTVRSRRWHVTHPRQMVMTIGCVLGLSTTAVARAFNRDHSTVVHAVARFRDLVADVQAAIERGETV